MAAKALVIKVEIYYSGIGRSYNMKNEKVERIEQFWGRMNDDPIWDGLKKEFADFAIPILCGEVDYLEDYLEKFTELWKKEYQLERRIDIKDAMDRFDTQFKNCT
jgi:hypothetical protein